jgi:hypothetical protein
MSILGNFLMILGDIDRSGQMEDDHSTRFGSIAQEQHVENKNLLPAILVWRFKQSVPGQDWAISQSTNCMICLCFAFNRFCVHSHLPQRLSFMSPSGGNATWRQLISQSRKCGFVNDGGQDWSFVSLGTSCLQDGESCFMSSEFAECRSNDNFSSSWAILST